MKRNTLSLTIALVLGGVMAAPGAMAKGRPGTETTQNLSVPTIAVGALGGATCGTTEDPSKPSNLVRPSGEPLTGYEVPGQYWVQKVHTWQAQCFYADTASVFGNWGDNLEGDARLKVGSPIRVELVLTNMGDFSTTLPTMQGYTVIKLEPSKLDRLSAYGHPAKEESGGWAGMAVDFAAAQWLVHDAGISFSVLNKDTDAYVLQPGTTPTAEINATGKIVYGYNLRLEEAGNYRIQFTTSTGVELTGQDAANGAFIDAHNVSIDITVGTGGGGGGGGGGGDHD